MLLLGSLSLFVNMRLGWKGLPHSSLLQTFVMYNSGLYYLQLSPLKKLERILITRPYSLV